MIYGTKTKHARYKLVHPEKYMENLAAPICKSSWEERIFQVGRKDFSGNGQQQLCPKMGLRT